MSILSLKTLIAAAIITTLTIGTVFGEDLAEGIMTFFTAKATTTLGYKNKISSVNSVVNISNTKKDGTLTLNDFSIDDNFLACNYGYYTEEDFSRVSKIRFNINNSYKINYDNAITVNLK